MAQPDHFFYFVLGNVGQLMRANFNDISQSAVARDVVDVILT